MELPPIEHCDEFPLTQEQKHDRAIFDAIKDWSRQAEASNSTKQPNLTPLLNVLDEWVPRSFWHTGKTKDFRKRTVVAFGSGEKTEANDRRRYVLPVHFAIMNALSLVPGMNLKMVDKTDGQNRPPNEQIHVINLNVYSQRIKAQTFGMTSILRILFNAPSTASIRERRGKDFRFIIPDHFILERYRAQKRLDVTTQQDVLDAVKKLLNDPRRTFPWRHPFRATEMVALLKSLFRIADKWYWDDLLDRLKDDPPYGRSKKMLRSASIS